MKEIASWDEYFMRIADEVATRATCDRKHVGAVIVRDKCILATGYNGSIRGLGHCDEDGHLMEDGHCVRTVHAESNAIIQAARNGVRIEGATVYVTASPCWGCFKMIANAGLTRIVFGEFYRDERIFRFAAVLGIDLVRMSQDPALVQMSQDPAPPQGHASEWDPIVARAKLYEIAAELLLAGVPERSRGPHGHTGPEPLAASYWGCNDAPSFARALSYAGKLSDERIAREIIIVRSRSATTKTARGET